MSRFRTIGLMQPESKSTRVSCKSSVPLIMSSMLVRTRNTNTSLWTLNEGAAHLLTENVHGMNLLIANKEVARPLTESVHGMNLSIMNEGVICLLIDRKNAPDLLIANKSVVHLLTASDSVVNLSMANKGVVLLSTGDTIASATCRLDVMGIMDLFLGRFLVHQFVLCSSGLLPQAPNPVLAHLNM